MKKRKSWMIFLLLISFSLSVVAQSKSINIKVLIGKNLSSINISGFDLELKRYHPFESHESFSGQKKFTFNCHPKKKAKKNRLLLTLSTPGQVIHWRGHGPYRGKIHIAQLKGKKNCTIINEVNLEKYISSLLAKEMNGNWPIEALKAQAIAARSYALYKMKINQKSLFHIISSESHQVSGTLIDETGKTARASRETAGKVLTHKKHRHSLSPIFYHAKCGGHTFAPEEVWDNPIKGIVQVQCPYCHNHGSPKWKKIIWEGHLAETLGRAFSSKEKHPHNANYSIAPSPAQKAFIYVYTPTGPQKVKKSFLRGRLGRTMIPSNNYQIRKENKKIIIEGEGLGHGVGLCQLGALDMADKGKSYSQILRHYFPHHRITDVKKNYQRILL